MEYLSLLRTGKTWNQANCVVIQKKIQSILLFLIKFSEFHAASIQGNRKKIGFGINYIIKHGAGHLVQEKPVISQKDIHMVDSLFGYLFGQIGE